VTGEPEDLLLSDAQSWWDWLSAHHADSVGVRLILAKKGVTVPTSLIHPQALEAALCFGWIDGRIGRRDDTTSYRTFTPRRARSPWSKINVASAERLIAEGRMQAAGLAEVERARADGRWQAAYAGQASITVPDDLRLALEANPEAAATFARLTSQNRYAILYRLGSVKRAETRSRKLEQYVAMLERGETIHPQKS
jgi:uncharacterized protein YdeI (YjbR/CyaY-like superfamily)